jgi:hypothetical protein
MNIYNALTKVVLTEDEIVREQNTSIYHGWISPYFIESNPDVLIMMHQKERSHLDSETLWTDGLGDGQGEGFDHALWGTNLEHTWFDQFGDGWGFSMAYGHGNGEGTGGRGS